MREQGKREAQLLVDDGTGKVEIWRIEDFEMEPLDKGLYGQFFGGDSYVILYTYLVNGKENYLIYFWLGQVSFHGLNIPVTIRECFTACRSPVRMREGLQQSMHVIWMINMVVLLSKCVSSRIKNQTISCLSSGDEWWFILGEEPVVSRTELIKIAMMWMEPVSSM